MKVTRKVSVQDLRDVDIFVGLTDGDLERIAEICDQTTHQVGEYVAMQGETTDKLLIVNQGKVAILMQVEVAPYTQTVTIAALTTGRVCAWSALVPPHALSASVKCTEQTEIIGLTASDLQRIFKDRPSIEATVMRNLAGVISSRLRENYLQLTRLIAEMIKQSK